jgi:hypothetical protein
MAEWGIGDQFDRTARQVRSRKTVHLLDQADSDQAGRYYETACGVVLHAAAGAVLTTDAPSCWACVPGGVAVGGAR